MDADKKVTLDPTWLPPELRDLFASSAVYDVSGRSTAKTYFVAAENPVFVKFCGLDLQRRELAMTQFFHRWNWGPEVISSGLTANGAYLVTRPLTGENGISSLHLSQPQRLAAVFGESLRLIHATPTTDCPFPHRQSEYLEAARENAGNGIVDESHLKEPFAVAAELLEKLAPAEYEPVVLHGDYCLPNIILEDFSPSGFVDLGNGGVGDPHYDLYWGIFTLEYNTGSDQYRDIFLDAYGRESVSSERLEFCRLLSAFMD